MRYCTNWKHRLVDTRQLYGYLYVSGYALRNYFRKCIQVEWFCFKMNFKSKLLLILHCIKATFVLLKAAYSLWKQNDIIIMTVYLNLCLVSLITTHNPKYISALLSDITSGNLSDILLCWVTTSAFSTFHPVPSLFVWTPPACSWSFWFPLTMGWVPVSGDTKMQPIPMLITHSQINSISVLFFNDYKFCYRCVKFRVRHRLSSFPFFYIFTLNVIALIHFLK